MPDTQPDDNNTCSELVKLPAINKNKRPEHRPEGDPCARCSLPAYRHRARRTDKERGRKRKWPEHQPIGDPCIQCGKYASKHRHRERDKKILRIIGIDGEGYGRGPHKYNLMGAADESGETWHVQAESLSPSQCFDFLLSLPDAVVVGFSLGYDFTKILQGLPDRLVYRLLHPETRAKKRDGRVIHKAVKWEGYSLNYMNGRLSVAKFSNEGKILARVVVWDIFRFFQSRFTKALTDWGIATDEQLEWLSSMKAKRGTFETEDPEEIQRYCLDECQKLARLFRELVQAHTDAGLVLKSYFGAGSTSTALLTKMGVKEQVRTGPDEAKIAIASAFVAGRFEDRALGPVDGPLFNSDINSAYPYHAFGLQCLGCGRWRYCDNVRDSDIRYATLALVNWTLPHIEPIGLWGPFPVRTDKGSLIYPWSAVGGWVWGKEFLNGKRLCPHVQSRGAWLYHTECEHHPFAQLPEYYLERLRVGKNTGRGKVFKLGPNGVYGKLAQRVGHKPPFQSFIWAGVITSNTRAQLLEAIATDPEAVLSLATDGIVSTRELRLPAPIETGTGSTGLPLGGWDQKPEGGRFFIRPGVSFPLGEGTVKARGYGKRNIEEQAPCIRAAWEHGHDWCVIDDGERFGSALSEISKHKDGYTRSERYGEWTREYTIMSFNPAPKRIGKEMALVTHYPKESLPYEPALLV